MCQVERGVSGCMRGVCQVEWCVRLSGVSG